jgi:hypothetical protein
MVLAPHAAASSTPLGTESEVCADVEWAFIGTVGRRISRWKDISIGRIIVSDLDVNVERPIHGRVPDVVQLTLIGGTVDGITQSLGGRPTPGEGDRLLFLVSVGDQQSELMGDRALRFSVRMAPKAALPSEALLRSIWVEHCGPSTALESRSQPSAEFLELIPKPLLEWCRHY